MDENMVLNSEKEINMEGNQISDKRLWNPKGFILISVLFSFLPAGILYSLNYGRLGDTKKKNISLAITFVAFVVMITMGLLINESIIKSIFYGLNIGAAAFMYNNQSKIFKNHILNGGRKASYLVPVLGSVVITTALLALAFHWINIPDQKLMFKGNELYYTQSVQKDYVEKLGTYLSEQGFFTENRKVSVKIDKQSATYEFSLIIDKSSLEDKELEQSLKDMSDQLSKDVFNNSKVDINICDPTFKKLKTISR
jgi:hypothetical protein